MTAGSDIKAIAAIREIEGQDHTADSVPLSERRDPLTMGLLWVTMVTGFPSVLIGFQWFKEGLTLTQCLICSIISCFILMLYCVPSSMLGCKSGLTYALLTRKVFGRWGSWLVSANMVWLCIAWYGLTAVFLGDGLRGLYQIPVPAVVLSIALAFAMAFNNFFGFSGVANFAKYAAGPLLVAWVVFTFFKAGSLCPTTVWTQPAQLSWTQALTVVSPFIIGYSVWGNEADYWRYGKPDFLHVVLPITVALLIGELLFPATGWMLAYMTHVTDYGSATRLMNNYAFGGLSVVAALVITVTYAAVNDSSLYGAINSLQNIHPFPRRKMVAGLAVVGSITAAVLTGVSKNFESVASLSCIFLPSATVVILAEHFLVAKLHKLEGELQRVPSFEELPPVRWSAVSALLFGCSVGVITSGLLPGTEPLHRGVPALQAWIATLVSYLVLRRFEAHQPVAAPDPQA